jgi:F0F1-type ATP synthase assembly protein I
METPDPQKKIVNKWALASIALELGFIIALPLVGLGMIGKWLDVKVGNTTPWFTLVGIVLAITASTTWLTKRLKEYIK